MTWVLIFTLLTIVPFSVLSGPGFFALSGLGVGRHRLHGNCLLGYTVLPVA